MTLEAFEELELDDLQRDFIIAYFQKYAKHGWEEDFSTLDKAKIEIKILLKLYTQIQSQLKKKQTEKEKFKENQLEKAKTKENIKNKKKKP